MSDPELMAAQQNAARVIAQAATTIDDSDVARVVQSSDAIERRVRKAPPVLARTFSQGRLLLEMIVAYRRGDYREVPWLAIATSTAALLYFINPMDMVPDVLPMIGQLDDALVIGAALKAVQSELKRFCQARGYDPGDYF